MNAKFRVVYAESSVQYIPRSRRTKDKAQKKKKKAFKKRLKKDHPVSILTR